MYGIPQDFPADLLVGATLEQVCVGQHDVQFRFDRAISISVSSSVLFDQRGEPTSRFAEIASSLCTLLGKRITAAEVQDRTALQLSFERGTLKIFDDSDQYESFTVAIGDIQVVV